MGYYVSNMIGIRLGGVFSGDADMEDLSERIARIAEKHREDFALGSPCSDYKQRLGWCLSRELSGQKGGLAVIAGVFNAWTFDHVAPFAAALSEEFGTEVFVMSHDEERDTTQCQVFLGGKPIHEVNESPIGQVLRRVT